MTEIIPAIIEDNWGEVEKKLSELEGKTKWVHLDASDGVFTSHKTWNNPGDLFGLDPGLSIEAHLMIKEPGEVVDAWLQDSVRRIIVHYEAFENKQKIPETAQKIKKSGRETVIAINPGTSFQVAEPLFAGIDAVLVMGVNPGWSGAEFRPEIMEKIKSLRERWPSGIIEVDGGVNAERAPLLVHAGADRLVSSSFVWSFKDPSEGIEKLKESV